MSAQITTVARDVSSACRYRAMLPMLDDPTHVRGSLHGGASADAQNGDLSIAIDLPKVTNDGHSFPSRLSFYVNLPVTAPGRSAPSTHSAKIMYFAGTLGIEVQQVKRDDTTISPDIRDSPDFDKVCPRTSPSGLYKLVLRGDVKAMTFEGLFVLKDVSSPAGQKIRATLRQRFRSSSNEMTLFVRDTMQTPLQDAIQELVDRQATELKRPFYHQFYDKAYHSFPERLPYMRFGKMPRSSARPHVIYNYESPVSVNTTEIFTKLGMGVQQVHEHHQVAIDQFSKTPFNIKIFKKGLGGNCTYIGLMKASRPIKLRLKEGDFLKISFRTKDSASTSVKWPATVIRQFGWSPVGFTNLKLSRPRKSAHQGSTTSLSKRLKATTLTEFIDFHDLPVTCGELTGVNDGDSFYAADKTIKSSQAIVEIDLHDTTARRQMYAIQALQRGERYTFVSKDDEDQQIHEWLPDPFLREIGQFMLFKTSLPKRTQDWLGAAKEHVQDLTDADQQEVVKQLFCNAPYPVGVLEGYAGSGKTHFMSRMLTAHVLTNNTRHVVGTPSNDAADVATNVVSNYFLASPKLKGKIIIRAHYERHEEGEEHIQDLVNLVKRARGSAGLVLPADSRKRSIPHYPDHSLEYSALCTAGVEGFPMNDLTAACTEGYHAASCRLFGSHLQELVDNPDGDIDPEVKERFLITMEKLFAFTIEKATVLVGTLTALASPRYVRNFKTIHTFWCDEAGQATIPDWLNVIARYVFKQSFLIGDTHQLKPVVPGPVPLTGFMPILEVSPMKLLQDADWPSVSLSLNRRSANGIIDIPSQLFYQGNAREHASAMDFTNKHKLAKPIAAYFRNEFFTTEQNKVNGKWCTVYFNSPTSSESDEITFSQYNSGNLAFCLNAIEKLVTTLKVPPVDIGYAAPYNAQCHRMKSALFKLQLAYQKKGQDHEFTAVKVAAIDSFQGGSRKVMIGDWVASERLGFLNDSGRNCVFMTRAEDFAIFIGNKGIGRPHWPDNYPRKAFDLAVGAEVCRTLEKDHAWLKHECVAG